LSEGIYIVSLAGETRKLTSPSDFPGDEAPAFSPDGRNLAFCRLAGFSTSEIYVLALDPNYRPAGTATRLTNKKRWSVNPEWTVDGSGIIYVSSWLSIGPNLTYLDISTPQAVPQTIPLIDRLREISLGRHLVYTRHIDDLNIWRAKIPRAGEPPALSERLIFSTWNDRAPAYSPDGKKIVFNSTRSGTPEIWISNSDGSRPVQMTSFGGTFIGTMSWSPDGQRIVFHARPEGRANLFVIPAAGGSPKRLTTDSDDTHPIYSRDGRWIYFGSSRSGIQQIWRMPAEGGEPKQITKREAIMPLESPDGKTIFFLLRHGGEIWSVPAQGGQETRVVRGVHHYHTGYAVTPDGIYYQVPPHSGSSRFIRHLSFSTGRDKPIAVASYPFDLGMSVSPDSRYIIFDQYEQSGSDLMLVQDFDLRKGAAASGMQPQPQR
jgi:Tol biopolymer transport system component